MHSLALASPSLPPRLAYTQAAQLQVAQQLAAQQAAVQAAAGGPPTTRSESALIRGLHVFLWHFFRYYTGSLHGREV